MGHGTPLGKNAVETEVAYAQLHLEALLSRLLNAGAATGRLLLSSCSSTPNRVSCSADAQLIVWCYIWLATVSPEHVCAKAARCFSEAMPLLSMVKVRRRRSDGASGSHIEVLK
jgi:hypothetical protein